ncbi:MAG: S8 family serine peptidase [candidate division KSB1 bacterium]|nr:S8 family serine peptidase [candidate division KSB1 bacterium]
MRKMWSTNTIVALMVAHLFAIISLANPETAVRSSRFPAYATNELLIQFKSDARFNSAALIRVRGATGFSKLDSLNALFRIKEIIPASLDTVTGFDRSLAGTQPPIFLFKFDGSDAATAAISAYRKLSIVERAEFNYFYFTKPQRSTIHANPDDIHLTQAAPFIKHLRPLLIGVIDTGLDWKVTTAVDDIWINPVEKADRKDNDHNGLIDDIWGYNFVDQDLLQQFGNHWQSKPIDDCGHGTRVAELISRLANFGTNNQQPHFHNQVMILKAGFQLSNGTIIFTTFSLVRAIHYAIDHHANIMHISCSGSFPSQFLQQAIQSAVKRGCLVVAAAGDDGISSPAYPAAFDEVLAATAIDLANKKLPASNFGDWLDLTAPGFLLSKKSISSAPSNDVAGSAIAPSNDVAGSAIAAAYVSGLAALVESSSEPGTVEGAKQNLLWSSYNLYPENPDFIGQLGAGKVHAAQALQKLYQPNIVLTKIAGYYRHARDSIAPGTPIPITMNFRNLSFGARNLRLRIAVDDSIGCILPSELILPELPFLHAFRNRQQPLILKLKRHWPVELPVPIILSIEADNGFLLTQTAQMPIETAAGIALSKVSEQPTILKWSADYHFAGYRVYRKSSDQKFFERITEHPVTDSTFVDYAAAGLTEAAYFVVGVDSAGLESLTSDTIAVQVVENLPSAFLSTSLSSDRPKVSVAFFQNDTLLTSGDSLQLRLQIAPDLWESLRYQWQLNGKIMNQHRGQTLSLPVDSLLHGENTIEVTISGSDTSITHRWIVRRQQTLPVIIFSPGPDTTINEGDSLRLAIHAPGLEDRLLKIINWQIHGRIDTIRTKTEFWFQPDFSAAGDDSIIVKYVVGDSIYTHCWRIHILNRNRPPIIQSIADVPPKRHSYQDTLRLWVRAMDPDGDSLSYRWYFNQAIDSTQVDSIFVFHGLRSSLKSDTIKVLIADRDTVIIQSWLLPIWHKNRAPQIINCIPLPETRLSTADSIRFQVLSQDADGDSLSFAWFFNSQLDSSAHLPTYLYRQSPGSMQNDTILVAIADADTTVTLQWIVFATPPTAEIANRSRLIWLPEDESIAIASDSVLLAVHHLPHETAIQWTINDSLVATSADSVFIHRRTRTNGQIDTVSASVVLTDSVTRHAWIVHFLPLAQQKNWRLIFQPDTSILIRSAADSIRLAVQISGAPGPAISFRWHVNGKISERAQDSVFWHRQPFVIGKPDTITLQISIEDTTIIHQWLVMPDAFQFLPAPRLISPLSAQVLTDAEKLIWENDSLLSAGPTIEPWQYVVQIATDSNFTAIVSSDTCTINNLPLNKCTGFPKLPVDRALYWRVKLFAADRYQSDFRKANRPFSFYPQFSQVENLSANVQEDGSITLSWTSFQDKNCAGFNLYRSESPQNNFIKLNDQLIIGKSHFSFQDLTAQAGSTYNYKLEEVSVTGKKKVQQMIMVTAPKPENYSLSSNFPNPFNSLTSFRYEIPVGTYVIIEVYNVLGKKVKTLVDAFKEPGIYTVYWDSKDDAGQNVVSGVYFYHMATAKYNMTHKMIVVR